MNPAWEPQARPEAEAALRLPGLFAELFDAAESMMESGDAAGFHDLRRLIRRLRYSLEMFQDFYDSADQRISAIQDLQHKLGDLNDLNVTAGLVHDKKVAAALREQASTHVAAFREFWRSHFDRPGQRDEWMNWLAHPKRQKASRKR